jgi:hypothetical protein
MSEDVKTLAEAARLLPAADLADLIDDLVTSLGQSDASWNTAWSKEADRRWSQHNATGHTGYAAEDVLADIAKRLEQRRLRL